jgi:hypothetical protein
MELNFLFSVIETFSRALLNQQMRCGYVTKEVSKIFQAAEDSRLNHLHPSDPQNASSSSAPPSQPLSYPLDEGGSNQGLPSEGETQANKRLTICEFVLQQSSLANELRALYHCLVGESMMIG